MGLAISTVRRKFNGSSSPGIKADNARWYRGKSV
jgi:hypothetical protein